VTGEYYFIEKEIISTSETNAETESKISSPVLTTTEISNENKIEKNKNEKEDLKKKETRNIFIIYDWKETSLFHSDDDDESNVSNKDRSPTPAEFWYVKV
jgi:hypothetical protein